MHAYPNPSGIFSGCWNSGDSFGKYTETDVEQPMPERLVALLKQLEATQRQSCTRPMSMHIKVAAEPRRSPQRSADKARSYAEL
jgi:hypothetical protein